MLADRVRGAAPGEWIVVLGGWSEEQFTDEPRGFPRDELDAIAPANPVVLQAVYNHSYLNSAALAAAKIDAETPDPPGGKIERRTSPWPRPGCPLQSFEILDEVCLLPVGEAEHQHSVVMIDDGRQSRGAAVVEIRRMLPERA
jgi:predicted amidohydrolase YtcJ